MPSSFNCHPCCRKAFTPAITCSVSSPSENRIGAGWPGDEDEDAIRIAGRVAMDDAVLVLVLVGILDRVAVQSPWEIPGCTVPERQSRERERNPRCMVNGEIREQLLLHPGCVGNGHSKWMRDGHSTIILEPAVNSRQEHTLKQENRIHSTIADTRNSLQKAFFFLCKVRTNTSTR